MDTGSFRCALIAALLVAAPLAALAQDASGSIGPNGPSGPLVLPNTSGTVTYQTSGGTEVAPGGTTVFHRTGSTTTMTFAGTRTPPSPAATAAPTIVPYR